MLRRVAIVKTDVSEEVSASIIRVTRISKLAKTLAVTSNRDVRYEIRSDSRNKYDVRWVSDMYEVPS
jgi:hypothetical protein